MSEPSDESLDAVASALSLIGLSRPIHVVDRIAGVPKGGEVAGSAARALANMGHARALTILDGVLFDSSKPGVVRETAAFGLGGCIKPEIFSIYTRAVALPEPDIRFRVLLSLRESLDKIVDVEQEYVRATLQALTTLLMSEVVDLQGGEHDLLVSILARYGGGIADAALSPVLVSGDNRVTVMRAFEVLRRRESKSARRSLAQALVAHDRPVQLYQALVSELSSARDEESKRAARRTLRRYPVHLRLISLVSRGERVRRVIHLSAARAVLNRPR